MVGLACDGYFLPANSLHSRDRSDGHICFFQNRTLFNMQLNESMRGKPRTGCRAVVTNSFQFVTDSCAINSNDVKGVFY